MSDRWGVNTWGSSMKRWGEVSWTPLDISDSIGGYPLDLAHALPGDQTADLSASGSDGDLINAPAYTTDRFSRANGAMEFNGINEYVDTNILTGLSGSGDFSINIWVKGSVLNYCVSQSKADPPAYASDFIIGGSSGSDVFWMRSVTLGNAGDKTSLQDGSWHMLTFIWDSVAETYEGFVDNASLGTSGVVTGYGGVSSIKIASRGDGTTAFVNGDLSDGWFWQRKLTASERLSLFTEVY